ncbi:MAG TPA: c-type cytochrome [Campylobacterales bacterium]|nr:c-type cytochrome [Campylobacterales bacterium]
MTKLVKLSMIGLSVMAFVGCNDTYSNTTEESVNILKSLDRQVNYLTDTNGIALYTFDKDVLNKSNCDTECQKIWPLFEGANTTSEDIKTLEGSDHLAFRQHPLYFFHNDKALGDVNGDNVKNVWHLVYAPENSNDTQTKFSEQKMVQSYLTDKDGRALYTFDKDEANVSNCYGDCEEIWPVYYGGDIATVPNGMQKRDLATIKRDANRSKTGVLSQTVYQGKPLYYFASDNKVSGATKGDWVKGVWHLVELSAKKASETTATTSPYTSEAAEKGKAIFTNPSKCASCHGVDGQTKPLGVDNVIARYGDAALIDKKLKDMRDNGNPNNQHSAMVNVAKGLSDEQIINLSAFVATLKK